MRRAAVVLCAALASSGLAPTVTWARPSGPRLSAERVVLRTDCGDLVVALYPSVAPTHASRFLALARAGVFDTVAIPRIEPGFVVQVGLAENRLIPLTDEQRSQIRTLPAEFSELRHERGTLSMARKDGDVDSATTSFSFLLGPAPHLDGRYTIFGRVVEGSDVLDVLEGIPCDARHRPLQRITIEKAEVVEPGADRGLVLRPATAPSWVAGAIALRGRNSPIGILALCVLGASGAGLWRARRRRSARSSWLRLLCLLSVTGLVWSVLGRTEDALAPWSGTLAFLTLFGAIRLLSSFETSAPELVPPARGSNEESSVPTDASRRHGADGGRA